MTFNEKINDLANRVLDGHIDIEHVHADVRQDVEAVINGQLEGADVMQSKRGE